MTGKLQDVKGYLAELEKNKEGRPEQIKDAIDIYIDLWNKAVENGVVTQSDEITDALAKIDKKGGLYAAAGD
jgi:hypothetical protein